jgi:DNA-binding transcriptional LysR family regulator
MTISPARAVNPTRRSGMELRHLRYFVAVAEELHFRRAAERLHVAQPAVSQQVRRLEEELGVQLLERTQHRVGLTPAGEVLLVEGRLVLEQAARAQRAVIGARDHVDGRLRIGHLPDAVPPALPRALERFAAATPGVEIVLETCPSLELIERVRDRRLDAAVVCLPAPVSGLRMTTLGNEGVVVALGESHPAAGVLAISPHQLEGTPLLMMARTTNPAFFDTVLRAWRDAGVAVTPTEVAEPSPEHLLLAVAAGLGAALVPASTEQRYATPGVLFLPLSSPSPTCPVVLISHPEHTSMATSSFLQMTRAVSTPVREVELTVAG